MSSLGDRHTHARPGASILANSVLLLTAYVVTRLFGFLTIIYLARVLGAKGFGEFSFSYAVFLYFTLLTHLGLMTYGTREIAREPGHTAFLTGNILAVRAVLAFVAMALLGAASLLLPGPWEVRLLVFLFGLSLFPNAVTLDWMFKGRERMGIVGLIEVLRTVPFLLLALLFVKGPSDALSVPILFLVGTTCAAFFSLYTFSSRFGELRFRMEAGYWKKSLTRSVPLGLAFMLLQVYYLSDTILLAFLKGSVSVGIYSSAYRIVTFLQGVGGWYFEGVFPVISRLHKESQPHFENLLNRCLLLTLWIALPMAVGGTLLAQPMMMAFYGSEYAGGVRPFQILLWAIAIGIVGMNFGYTLMACGHSRQYLRGVGLGAATSVLLNLALIPSLGLIGASLARLGSEVVIASCFWVSFRRLGNWSGLHRVQKPLFACALMAVAVVTLQGPWVLRMAAGILVYVTTILAIASRERAEISRVVSELLRRRAKANGASGADPFTEPESLLFERGAKRPGP